MLLQAVSFSLQDMHIFCASGLLHHSKGATGVLPVDYMAHRSMLQAGSDRQASAAPLVQHSPEVGSSRRMTEGLISSSCPTDTRLRSPPEIPLWKKPPAGTAMALSETHRYPHNKLHTTTANVCACLLRKPCAKHAFRFTGLFYGLKRLS